MSRVVVSNLKKKNYGPLLLRDSKNYRIEIIALKVLNENKSQTKILFTGTLLNTILIKINTRE